MIRKDPRQPLTYTNMSSAVREQPALLCFGRHIYPYGHAEDQGCGADMEDAVACIGDFAGSGSAYYGVFDGHNGCEASKYAAYNIHRVFNQNYSSDCQVDKVMRETLVEVNEALTKQYPNKGTTFAAAIIIKNDIYTANIGDTRIILVTEAGEVKQLSEDHRPTVKAEHDMITSHGGFVLRGKTNGELSVSRCLGDKGLSGVISAEPYTTRTHRVDGMALVITTGDVSDVMDNQAIARMAVRSRTPQAAANAIKAEALKRGCDDNITIIVVFLTPK